MGEVGDAAASTVPPSQLEDWTQEPAASAATSSPASTTRGSDPVPPSSLDDWLQGPLEQSMEQSAEDAWSTAESVSRQPDRGQQEPDPDQDPAQQDRPERPVFRRELHGLRALALMLVAVYHIWLGRVSGGVDVFLFLSAFFLTGTFVRRLDAGRPLAVPRYWLHTFKRLLPPAAVTILATLAATWWLLPPSIWPTVMQQSAASIGYVQNVLLVFQEVDYQARDAGASSPLQHFWSLSVQGQAFLLWPPLFLLAVPLARRGKAVRRPLLGLMALIVAASLTWSIIETASNQPVAYFDTGARLWEFAAGSMLALALPWIDRHTGARRPEDETAPRFGTQRAMLGWAGLIALLACGILLNVSSVFPGWIAIWPLTGAAAVVIAGHTSTRWGVDRLLSTRPAAFIGDISYALYLVHWPVLVLWLHRSGQERAGLLDGLVVLFASGVLAWLLTRLVDAPIRRSAWLEARPWRALTAVAASIALVLGAAGGWWVNLVAADERATPVVAVSDGGGAVDPSDGASGLPSIALPSEPITYVPEGWQLRNQWPGLPHACKGDLVPDQEMEGTACETLLPADSDHEGTMVVVGSSHARQLIPALSQWARQNDWQIINLHRDQCNFEVGLPQSDRCHGYGEWALSYLDTHPADLAITTSTVTVPPGAREDGAAVERMPTGSPAAIQALLDRAVPVLAVRDNPRWDHDQYVCAEEVILDGGDATDADRACGADASQIFDANDPSEPLDELTGAEGARVHRVDLSSRICPDGRCSPIQGNVYMYLDDNHLSRTYTTTALSGPMSHEVDMVLSQR